MAGKIDDFYGDDKTEKVIGYEVAAEGRIIRYEKLSVSMPDGSVSSRDIVRHPGGCVIVPIDREGYVYLVRQYRVAFERVTIELPAGKLDKGETPLECAKRELFEETGITAGDIKHVTSIMTSPGFCDEVLHVFIATDLDYDESAPDEDEFINVIMFPLEELINLIMTGKIRDAKTIVGALIADRGRRCGEAGDGR